jgi:hypothetical protein
VKREQPNTLFPIDTTRGENLRPIRQQFAIIAGIMFAAAFIFSIIPDVWK